MKSFDPDFLFTPPKTWQEVSQGADLVDLCEYANTLGGANEIRSAQIVPYSPSSFLCRSGACKALKRLEKLGIPNFRGWKFLTITIDPNKFKDASEAYDHVNRNLRFRMRELSKVYRVHKWLCKLELQENGYPHFHLLVDSPDRWDFEEIDRIFPWGFTNVQRVKSEAQARYVFKYLSKEFEDLPEWFLKLRQVRIIRTSRGFWENVEMIETEGTEKEDDPSFSVPETIGERIEKWKYWATVRVHAPDGRIFSKLYKLRVPFIQAVLDVVAYGREFIDIDIWASFDVINFPSNLTAQVFATQYQNAD